MTKYWLALLFAVLPTLATAHSLEPIYITIVEQDEYYRVSASLPTQFGDVNTPRIEFPTTCLQQTAYPLMWHYQCERSVIGEEIKVVYPNEQPTGPTMLHFERANGESQLEQLPDNLIWVVPANLDSFSVYKRYLSLGFEHILAGFDHLLFVVCLLLLAKGSRKTLLMITGFTVAHCITLIMSTYRWVQLPIHVVELCIAISLFMLVLEIVQDNKNSLTHRYPFTVASLFGLLHGFGFASVLLDIGVPQEYRFIGLLFFNLGVEFAQLIVIGLCLLVRQLSQKMGVERTVVTQHHTMIVTVVGGLSVYWMIDRTLLWLT
ncbi:HupE/UreJ family protein [Vibrio agarivorans]|uniref:HupE/UreJ family protein n=1 Tax=Vibrio agarivorans TaxID=153622 RepID=A0ABT7Y630_9VIBR|nr:HupE/UreJ family protein [Vibrio agarivorans]MDN2483502.1 HupE/UreJ family protein [Vibrio agarivorans]